MHEPLGEPELVQEGGDLGAPGQERLGADVVGHPGQVDRAQHAADPVALLQQRDDGLRSQQHPQAMCGGQSRDPGPDDRDAHAQQATL